MKRARFVRTALTASAALVALPAAAAASETYSNPSDRADGALVFSGGGARGAYEAGWIEGLRRVKSVRDGAPLPGIGVACGSSIGAINAWFVATAQYDRLAEVWHGIGRENVFQLKRRFAATANPHAFILTKIVQALSLAEGLTKNVRGLLDGDVVQNWIERHVDPDTPLVTPLVFTATNLDRRRAELFYKLPRGMDSDAPASVIERIAHAVGAGVPVRLADSATLTRALRASTAIPVLFDPVTLPSPEGTMDRFVDGGISDNTPIDVGRALARNVYLVLCDPPGMVREPYSNALEIAVGAFGVAQQRIFDSALEAARAETEGRRLFDRDSALTPAQRRFIDRVLDAEIYIGRPFDELPVQTAEMDRQSKIDTTYGRGLADAQKGWKQYT